MKKTSIKIIKILRKAGYEAYWAGGCVRDLLMGKEPCDYDIVTSAKPDQIENLLEKTIPVGKKYGVIVTVLEDHRFEVATFRSDASYTDGRRPDAVYFTSAKEDALRRDFTINGMFYDPISKKVLDYVSGQDDIKNKIVRFIGDPEERIKEDNLRLLRAIRFKNSLRFKYDKKTFEAISRNAKLIKNVTWERISEELNKMLQLAGREDAFSEMDKAGILDYVLPELVKLKGVKQPEKYHKEGDVFTHTILSLKALPDKVVPELAWATLLHDIGKPDTYKVAERIRFDGHAELGEEIVDKIARRLKFSTSLRENVKWLVKHHMTTGNVLKMTPSHQASFVHHPLFDELVELLRADELGSEPKDLSLYKKLKKLIEKQELLLPKPKKLISGKEVMKEFGVGEGSKLGKILSAIDKAQIEGKVKTKKQAKDFIKNYLQK